MRKITRLSMLELVVFLSFTSLVKADDDFHARMSLPRYLGHDDYSQRGSFQPFHSGRETILHNTAVLRTIHEQRPGEVLPNHYYSHVVDGHRYYHYYHNGAHWYGFYHGTHFYWNQYYGDHWWWYDGPRHRWAFWSEGYWWSIGVGGVLFVYTDDGFYPYDSGVVAVSRPLVPAAPQDIVAASAVAPLSDTTRPRINSPDGTRQVQITGSDKEASLYDLSSGTPTFLKILDKQVEKVRFSGGAEGNPLRILLDYKDGTFMLLDANGNPLMNENSAEATVPSATNTTTTTSEDSLPPVPPPGL